MRIISYTEQRNDEVALRLLRAGYSIRQETMKGDCFIIDCDQSDGYLRKWASIRLNQMEYLKYHSKLIAEPE